MNNFEIKTLDHTANFAIALTSLLVCGIEGLNHKMTLPEPYSNDPYYLSKAERKKREIEELPLTLDDRIKAIYSDDGLPLRTFFGEDLVHNILEVAKEDEKYFKSKTFEDEVNHIINQY
jgi:glutamine synthetase